ncbi:hypothetical protein LWM68_24545 [Niabella sp. W65]|nr:hypothetical protein [Niabella sp. W65]MCH7365664.1 hypothetical protein [Niabella sp. W65]ULT41435.1 hypothetical protein KRR40_43440 [Niabella sp. I65]
MGIFRPVHLVVTNELRIEPFGVHAWAELSGNTARLNINTTVKNYGALQRAFTIVHHLIDKNGRAVATINEKGTLRSAEKMNFR